MTNLGDDFLPVDPKSDGTEQEASQVENNNEGAETISAPSGSSGESSSGNNDFAKFEEDLGEDSLLAKVQAELEQTKDDLARSRAETFNVRQDYGNYVRRAKEEAGRRRVEGQHDVVEALMPVLDDIAAARSAGELAEGPFASIAEKLEAVLASSFDYEQYGEEGDHFDPQLYDALMMQPNP
ncbi:MAG: nucleotide exchange factor GrpE, partial [Scrofimicrobium sp.]